MTTAQALQLHEEDVLDDMREFEEMMLDLCYDNDNNEFEDDFWPKDSRTRAYEEMYEYA